MNIKTPGALWRLVCSMPIFAQFAILLALLLLKNGWNFEDENIERAYLPAAKALPLPDSYVSSSLGNLIIARLLGIESVYSWQLLHLSLIFLAFTIIVWHASRSSRKTTFVLVLIFSAPATSSVLNSIGKYDVFTYLGGYLLVASTKKRYVVTGSLLIALGNPEQAVFCSLCLFLLSISKRYRTWRISSLYSIAIAVLCWIFIQTWMLSQGVWSNRISIFPVFLEKSLGNFFSDFLGNIWSWHGLLWLPLLTLILIVDRRTKITLLTVLIVIPGSLSITTADGFRVASLVSFPILMIVVSDLLQNANMSLSSLDRLLGSFLLLWIIVPVSKGEPTWGSHVSEWFSSNFIQLESFIRAIQDRMLQNMRDG
jgi:hypothetical protein